MSSVLGPQPPPSPQPSRSLLLSTRVSSKQTKKFGSNRNKICFFWETKKKKFCLFRCFEPISKQTKQTELVRNKNTKICSLWLLFYLFRFYRNTETLFSVQKRNYRNKRFVSDSAETCFGSSFGCFELKLVSKDNLPATFALSYPFFSLCRGSIPARGRRGEGPNWDDSGKLWGSFW